MGKLKNLTSYNEIWEVDDTVCGNGKYPEARLVWDKNCDDISNIQYALGIKKKTHKTLCVPSLYAYPPYDVVKHVSSRLIPIIADKVYELNRDINGVGAYIDADFVEKDFIISKFENIRLGARLLALLLEFLSKLELRQQTYDYDAY
jgi:hypothetical protein